MQGRPHVCVLSGSLVLLLVTLLMACPSAATQTSAAPPATSEVPDAGMLHAPEASPKRGGVLRWGGLANSTFYDLHQTGTIANMGPQAPMYDLLVQVDPVYWDKVIPDLATRWTISEDGLTYTFSLREGVKFHDGASLTAEDVVASFHHIISPPAGVLSPRQGLFDAVKEVVATDPLTVEFRLTEPRGYLLRGLAAGFNVIMRKQTLEANNYDLRRVPVYPGTGPFRHKSLEPGVVRRLERNPDYWNPALPYLEGIDIYHLDVGPKTGAACLAHSIDYCFAIDPISEEKAKKIRGLHTARIYPHAPHGLWFNFRKKPFDDVRVRKAMNLVLDKAAIVDATQEMFPVVRAGWLLPTDPLFQAYWNKAREQPGWRSPTAEDLAEAKRLMKEAGYENGIKGVDFLIRDISFYLTWGPIVQDILKRELKIETTIRVVASGVWWEEAQRGNFDISIYGYGATIPHVADYWNAGLKTGGGYNFYGYANPAFDAIVAATARESDPAKLKALIDQGTAILDQDMPAVVWANPVVPIAWWDTVKGHGTATRGINFWEGMRNEIWWLAK
jgi:peptide/nickel transport system substrate-binding protein